MRLVSSGDLGKSDGGWCVWRNITIVPTAGFHGNSTVSVLWVGGAIKSLKIRLEKSAFVRATSLGGGTKPQGSLFGLRKGNGADKPMSLVGKRDPFSIHAIFIRG